MTAQVEVSTSQTLGSVETTRSSQRGLESFHQGTGRRKLVWGKSSVQEKKG